MEEQVERLVDKVWNKLQETPTEQRILIAIGGIPGSGKTTLSQTLARALNARQALTSPTSLPTPLPPVAIAVPMDGFHLTRAQLSAMPNPALAHARRGAEFTFALELLTPFENPSYREFRNGNLADHVYQDGAGFLALVRAVRQPVVSGTMAILAPGFDHAVKDPVEGANAIELHHRVVAFEGNYVVLDREPWKTAAALMDERWFVAVDPEVAKRRLVRRHVAAGITDDEADAENRVVDNDLVNGEEIGRGRLPVDEEIVSREDGTWVHE